MVFGLSKAKYASELNTVIIISIEGRVNDVNFKNIFHFSFIRTF